MVQARVISQEEIAAIEAKGKKIKGRREYRRLESVLLRAKEGKTAEEIAIILRIHPRTALWNKSENGVIPGVVE